MGGCASTPSQADAKSRTPARGNHNQCCRTGVRSSSLPSGSSWPQATVAKTVAVNNFYQLRASPLGGGQDISFEKFRGKVCLVVNVASK